MKIFNKIILPTLVILMAVGVVFNPLTLQECNKLVQKKHHLTYSILKKSSYT